MKTILAKWFFLKSLDDGTHSPRFVVNRLERSAKFAAWARSMTEVDQRLADDVDQAEATPSIQMHRRTMDALRENAFATNTNRPQRHLPRFAAVAFCVVVVAAGVLADRFVTSRPSDPITTAAGGGSFIDTMPTFDLRQRSDAILASYVHKPLDEEGRALVRDAQRVGEYLLNRLPLRSTIRPASYTPDPDD
jgi:hypothetical protein